MKILHLPYGIGISVLARALRNHGVDAVSVSLRKHHYDYMADVRVNFDLYPLAVREKKRKAYFQKVMEMYDVYHFHFGETFFPDKSDLKILKSKGKKMIVHHRGSETRLLSVARSFNNPYVRVKPSWSEKKIHAHLKKLATYIDEAIVPDHEILPYVEKYYKKVHVVPYAIDVSSLNPQYPLSHANPLIVHAPSNRDIKGTDYIIAAVNRLKKEGLTFRFKLVENLPHKIAQQLYQQSTIIIDQIQIGSYANLSMEAMAMGKPVVCFIRDDLRQTFPQDLPIVSANPDTIYSVLKDLLNQPDLWPSLGMKGRRYVEENHNYEKIAKMLIEIYRQL